MEQIGGGIGENWAWITTLPPTTSENLSTLDILKSLVSVRIKWDWV